MYSRHFYFRYYSDSSEPNFFLDLYKLGAQYCWFSVLHFDRSKTKHYRYVFFTKSYPVRLSSISSCFDVKPLGLLRYCFLSEFRGPFTFFDLSLLDIDFSHFLSSVEGEVSDVD